ncbi:MAG TPA: hypothetical protein VN684_10970, partial [Terriglobales bacterium]|nr:hypothetical protein [Terriglobales bacterium]
HDANLLAPIINYANFSRPNTLINADKTLVDNNPPNITNREEMKNYSTHAGAACSKHKLLSGGVLRHSGNLDFR